jgi:hypothetical protein
MGPLDIHLRRLQERAPGATAVEAPGAGWIVRIPNVELPPGWSKARSDIRFVAPNGYPFAQPDCFWADVDLRLANGNVPQSANPNNALPGSPEPGLWFSWHLQQPWNPNRDDFLTWLAVIRQRFARAQ